EIVSAAILREGHAQQAARELLRMRSVCWPDQFYGIEAPVAWLILSLHTASSWSQFRADQNPPARFYLCRHCRKISRILEFLQHWMSRPCYSATPQHRALCS